MFLGVSGHSSNGGFRVQALLPCLHVIEQHTPGYDPQHQYISELHARISAKVRPIYFALLVLLIAQFIMVPLPLSALLGSTIYLYLGKLCVSDFLSYRAVFRQSEIPQWHSAEHRLVLLLRKISDEHTHIAAAALKETNDVSSSCGTVIFTRIRLSIFAFGALFGHFFLLVAFGQDNPIAVLGAWVLMASVVTFFLHIPIGRWLEARYMLAEPASVHLWIAAVAGNEVMRRTRMHDIERCIGPGLNDPRI